MKEITQLAAELGRRLQVLNAHVAAAESCTGGGISEAITRIPGSSAWFEAGYVTYSNRQKTEQLNVPPELFETVGAVSREVVEAMVQLVNADGAFEQGVRKVENVLLRMLTE
ncbi:CinA family protein, partial [Pseudomonas mandelii]|uniref:CinA family protein n=1 Tax=Pseudomonas mandelii TaxID=75612 RepID=UPI003D0525AE